MIKILLLGKNGQVGYELHRSLLPLGEVVALDAPELDFTNLNLLREQVLAHNPQVLVNAVAYTNVDQAESHPELVMQVNAYAPGLLAELCCQLKAVLVHYSTDFVYDGTKREPYTEEDIPNPLNHYALSKLEGDQRVLSGGGSAIVLRSSWIYSDRRDNFLKKVLSWARTREELGVVTDTVSNPTWARDLAQATTLMLAEGRANVWDWAQEYHGLYHLAGSGSASRYEWAEEILRLDPNPGEQVVRVLKPASSKDFPLPAPRPLFTPLDCTRFQKTFGFKLPDWRTSLRLAMEPA